MGEAPDVFAAEPACREQAARLAKKLGSELLAAPPASGTLYLYLDGSGVGVHRSGARQRPIRVDFLSPSAGYRSRFGGGFKQALARAAGVSGKQQPTVLDTTAGLGRDAFVLASLGCRVTLLERSPVVCAMLADGLRRARADARVASVTARMQLYECDALQWLERHADRHYDVIYIDPMFPARRKSALVKGEMQVLHDLVGVGEEVEPVLKAALARCAGRVVVKRPKLAPDSTVRDPDFTLKGRSNRFDVYLGHAPAPVAR